MIESADNLRGMDHMLMFRWVVPRSAQAFRRQLWDKALHLRGMHRPKRRVLLRVLARRRAGKGRQ